MQSLGKIIVFLALMQIIASGSVFSEDQHTSEDHVSEESEAEVQDEDSGFAKYEEKLRKSKKETSKKPQTYKFKGFTGYRAEFTELCRMIDDDGQKVWLSSTAENYSKSMDRCPPCRTLYQTIFTACNVKKGFVPKVKKKNAQEQDTIKTDEQSKIASLDPSTELIDRVSAIFREMAQTKSEQEAEAYYTAMEHLIAEMRKPESKSISQKEYYSTLAEYIEAPFYSEGFLKKERNSVKSPSNLPIVNPSRNIDDLF